jgi:transcriptional regulator with XRE-family HTH domain
MERAQLADFLRTRREALQPEDVGMVKGPRRRAKGLRREEVAALCEMSVDYLSRLEQRRGPQPSEQMIAAMARGLRLSLDDRDHLFRLAGHPVPARALRGDHVSPALMRVMDRLRDTPAQVVTELGETLAQTAPAAALLGDLTHFTGRERFLVHRWFTDPSSRSIYPPAEHEWHGRILASGLRDVLVRRGEGSRADDLVRELSGRNPEFVEVWKRHEVGLRHGEEKDIAHPEHGLIRAHCQTLHDTDGSQSLLIFTATPGTGSYEKLRLLSVVGTQEFGSVGALGGGSG